MRSRCAVRVRDAAVAVRICGATTGSSRKMQSSRYFVRGRTKQ